MDFYLFPDGHAQGFDNPTPDQIAGATKISADQFAQKTMMQVVTPAMAQTQLRAAAQAKLNASDLVALRCFKASVTFPAPWQAYVQALRAIANGTDTTSTTLPAAPAYIPGT